jgi:hypothetical protein
MVAISDKCYIRTECPQNPKNIIDSSASGELSSLEIVSTSASSGAYRGRFDLARLEGFDLNIEEKLDNITVKIEGLVVKSFDLIVRGLIE